MYPPRLPSSRSLPPVSLERPQAADAEPVLLTAAVAGRPDVPAIPTAHKHPAVSLEPNAVFDGLFQILAQGSVGGEDALRPNSKESSFGTQLRGREGASSFPGWSGVISSFQDLRPLSAAFGDTSLRCVRGPVNVPAVAETALSPSVPRFLSAPD